MIKKYNLILVLGITLLICSCKSNEATIGQLNDYKQLRTNVYRQFHSSSFADLYKISKSEQKSLTQNFVIDCFGKPSYKCLATDKKGMPVDGIFYVYYYPPEISDTPKATLLLIKCGVWENPSTSQSLIYSSMNVKEFKEYLGNFQPQMKGKKRGEILGVLKHFVNSNLLTVSTTEIKKYFGNPEFIFNADDFTIWVYSYDCDNNKFLAFLYFDSESLLSREDIGIDANKFKNIIKMY